MANKLFVKFLRALLAALGFSSLSSCDGSGLAVCMYGVPDMMDYEVSGSLHDKDGNPIVGIKVTVPRSQTNIGTVRTSETGSFEVKGEAYHKNDLQLTFIDVDGFDNGGHFETNEVTVSLEKVSESDRSGSVGRYVAKDVEVVMTLSNRNPDN